MNGLVEKALFELCRKVDTPKSLGIWLRYQHARSEFAGATIDPRAYNDAATFFKDYACVNLLRKYEGLDTGVDTREVALLAFNEAEKQCEKTNERFRTYATTGQVDQVEPAILALTQKLIAKVWGQPSFEETFRHCGWGPGATATLKGDDATTEDKMSELPMSITPAALPYLRQVQKSDLLWCGHLIRCPVEGAVCLMPIYYNQIDYSRLLTVPKDAKTDRTIAAEPTGNIFLQKGVGGYLRRRLRKYGVNLDDQSRNQALAEIAAMSKLATLDLSAASDTVSIGLCKVLLPPDMFQLLDCLRSPAYSLGKDVSTRFHKFSSMGNGFTFELESLIFWAAAKAVQMTEKCRGPIGVYGDDIIVSQQIARKVIVTLESFGFKINEQKSFIDGRFFESCGKHYFDTVDVTPVYQKHVVRGDLEICRFVNRVYDLAYKRPFLDSEKSFGSIHSRLFRGLPKPLKKYSGPGWAEGDGFFRVRNYNGRFSPNRGYFINYMKVKPAKEKAADGGLYAYVIRKSDEPLPKLSQQKVLLLLQSYGLSAMSEFNDIATNGNVSIRPKGRTYTFKHAKRWVSLFGKVTPEAQRTVMFNE